MIIAPMHRDEASNAARQTEGPHHYDHHYHHYHYWHYWHWYPYYDYYCYCYCYWYWCWYCYCCYCRADGSPASADGLRAPTAASSDGNGTISWESAKLSRSQGGQWLRASGRAPSSGTPLSIRMTMTTCNRCEPQFQRQLHNRC
jgi:hypothetical protein